MDTSWIDTLSFEPDMQKAMIDNFSMFREIHAKEDDYVFHAGMLINSKSEFYVILEGSVRILIPIKDKTINSGQPKMSIFGQTEINTKLMKKATRRIDDRDYTDSQRK